VSGIPAAPWGKADAVSLVTTVEVPRRSASLLEPIVGGERYQRLVQAADRVRQLQAGRTIWNVSSTAVGGAAGGEKRAFRKPSV